MDPTAFADDTRVIFSLEFFVNFVQMIWKVHLASRECTLVEAEHDGATHMCAFGLTDFNFDCKQELSTTHLVQTAKQLTVDLVQVANSFVAFVL